MLASTPLRSEPRSHDLVRRMNSLPQLRVDGIGNRATFAHAHARCVLPITPQSDSRARAPSPTPPLVPPTPTGIAPTRVGEFCTKLVQVKQFSPS